MAAKQEGEKLVTLRSASDMGPEHTAPGCFPLNVRESFVLRRALSEYRPQTPETEKVRVTLLTAVKEYAVRVHAAIEEEYFADDTAWQ